jgi:hypothetical protein
MQRGHVTRDVPIAFRFIAGGFAKFAAVTRTEGSAEPSATALQNRAPEKRADSEPKHRESYDDKTQDKHFHDNTTQLASL